MHVNRMEQQRHLTRMLCGFYQYFGLNNCVDKLRLVRLYVVRQWVKFLRKRSQRHNCTWKSLNRRNWFKLPSPVVVHVTV